MTVAMIKRRRDDLTLHLTGLCIEAPANALAYSWTQFIGGHLDDVTTAAPAPAIEKYARVLAAADVFVENRTFRDGVDPARPRLRLPGAPLIAGLSEREKY
jgi:hypothetical protein